MAEYQEFQVGGAPRHPNHEIVTVQNLGGDEKSWSADGQAVTLAPKGKDGSVQRMPRWVYLLGLRYPGHSDPETGLKELDARSGSIEFELDQKRRLQADIERRKADLAKQQEELKALEEQIKVDQKEAKKNADK